jgi:hypothetical protein
MKQIEKKLEVLRRAMEQGADIDINFHGIEGRGKAEELIKSFADQLDVSYREDFGTNSQWFKFGGRDFEMNVFFKKDKKDLIADFERRIAKLMEETA